MGQKSVFSGDIDPDIADLLGTPQDRPKSSAREEAPAYTDLFGGDAPKKEPYKSDVDLTKKTFNTTAKLQEERPSTVFMDPEYYKKALANENELSTQFHNILTKYLQAKDPKDKGVYKQNLQPVYWELLGRIAHRAPGNIPPPKQMLLRFGIMTPGILSPEQKDLIARLPMKNESGEPIYYIDEWLKAVATGLITQSSTDEVKTSKSDEHQRYQTLLNKAQGKRDAAESVLKAKAHERRTLESSLKERASSFYQADGQDSTAPYSDGQKKTMTEINEIMRDMLSVDKELLRSYNEFEQADEDLGKLSEKLEGLGPSATINTQALAIEFETVRQMTKMCIGRQGNHFPLLIKEYFHGGLIDLGSRENIINIMAWIESVDSEAYCRSHKNTLNRIVPYVILSPCYGDLGVCWEPFDRYNRATSRGRICIPMYPKNLKMAVVYAVADLRWQVAKEKASYYWMEEGLTGNYYQWFQSRRLKGDVKIYFIADYINWLFKESEGIQKLDKTVRQIFWRFLPFSQEIKEKLKGRSMIYQELYQRDVNRSLSDGY